MRFIGVSIGEKRVSANPVPYTGDVSSMMHKNKKRVV